MRLARRSALAILCLAAPACADPWAEDYARHAIGHFSSLAQHRADPAFEEVEARIQRIWPDRDDGIWIYQEQTILSGPAAAPGRPYFQRVGRIHRLADGRLSRDTFAIRDPARFAGLGRDGYAGPALTPADLAEAGCPQRLEPAGPGAWIGLIDDCPNRHRGAVAMIGRSILTPQGFVNWDRGIAADGRQRWGPTKGGYVFDRVR